MEVQFVSEVVGMVEEYILIRKGVKVSIAEPTTQVELNKLGYAYDYALAWFSKNGYSII